ncbi:hypothetical protein FEDK69T_01780 [Flavobacterium enshiense DK69]|uniref:Carboxypeptidase-like regulatory domain-containing protein n=1 Tax=Flavobacterium enshiense DK69 TaxID=1107311 RepID=V6SFI7_9FLAO|nr:carboxypeptidase-like regulatory domain-containing protein [Flavobacterium enshiense]ESU25209.1 hypothetical protein FEDK69T_01780 [Flavobacterium enshiense DK69]KGO96897.1 hypothetical protein Q767_04165 [Flavobacterium enshiense DK69]
MIRTLIHLFLFLLGLQSANAQNLTGKIIDSKTGESLPYANIIVNETVNLVSNAEGNFTLTENNNSDTTVLTVSYLGYVKRQLTVGELKNLQYIIRLEPGVFELENLTISNVKPDPYAIMAEVKKNLPVHYKNDGQSSKNMLFYRDGTSFKPKKIDVEITKSTGFTENALKSTNAEMNAFTAKLISHPPKELKDMLCNYYTLSKKKDDKPTFLNKLEVIKATVLKNGDNSVSLDDIEETGTNIVLKHLDTTKFYRIKSGWFGSRDTISLSKNYNEKKNKKDVKNKNTKLTSSKANLTGFIAENNPLSSKLDFLNKPELYEYSYESKIYNDENDGMYVLKFEPRKSKAKYSGKLYISETDYAVVRCDYNLADGKDLGGFNMKLLLGVKVSENISKGTILYKKSPEGTGYYLQYASEETGQYFYINRPLKFIELTNSEKDVVAFDFKVEGNLGEKTEFLNISKSEISENAFENIKEEDFNYLVLKRYDPAIWKDFVSIEPLEEMKQFRVTE